MVDAKRGQSMLKMNKNFIYMWLPVMAFILGSLAIKYDIRSLFLVFGAYAFCLVIVQVNVKKMKPKQAANHIKKTWPQD